MNREFYHQTLNNHLSLLQKLYCRIIPKISMRSDRSQREWPYVNQLALQHTAIGIGAFYLVGGFKPEEESTARRRASRQYCLCTGYRSAHTSSLFISTEWVIVYNNTTIWPRPIRDLTTLLSHPPVIPLRSKRAALRASTLSFPQVPWCSHRFNGDPCHDPTSRACVRACLRACVFACTHSYTGAHVA